MRRKKVTHHYSGAERSLSSAENFCLEERIRRKDDHPTLLPFGANKWKAATQKILARVIERTPTGSANGFPSGFIEHEINN